MPSWYDVDMIIGLSGYARAGKDEVGRVLADEFNFERRGVGDVLHEVLLGLDPLVHIHDENLSERATLLDHLEGYDWLKDHTEYRELQQRLGDVLRKVFGQECLMDALFGDLPANTVFTSTRHLNEADRIKAAGGEVWRIVRPGTAASNDHITETALDDYGFDAVIVNNGTLDELHALVRLAVAGYGTGPR